MRMAKQKKNHPLPMPALACAVVATILGWAVAAQAQAVHGSGTTNTIPLWTSNTTIGDSLMKQSGTNVNVSGGLVATTLSGNGSGVTNVNALTLGGLGPGAFAQVGTSNTFTADQAINGNLTLAGSMNNSLTLQGNVSDSSGDESANVIGGFGGSGSAPGNSVASGVVGATIAGGGGFLTVPAVYWPNIVNGNWGTVGGGTANTAGGSGTVAGGNGNLASGDVATVGGGNQNTASGVTATVGGGGQNTASGDGATVGGGGNNRASGSSATVSGGAQNTASLDGATVAGGEDNQATGKFATVAGGFSNFAVGQSSFVAGTGASATYEGSFVWSDNSGLSLGGATDTGPNSFVARASGGFTFYTAPGVQAGATLAAGSGSWSSLSDRDAKANFTAVDGQALLARLAALPMATWNYKAQPDSVRHMGPTAQDFREAFGLGEDEKHISTVDAQGVALAAIQALYNSVTELKKDLGDRDREILELRSRLAHLEQGL